MFLLPHNPHGRATPLDARGMTDDASFAQLQQHPSVLACDEIYFWAGSMSVGKLTLLNQYPLQALLAHCCRCGSERRQLQSSPGGQLLLGQ
jgi:hypothetical protein